MKVEEDGWTTHGERRRHQFGEGVHAYMYSLCSSQIINTLTKRLSFEQEKIVLFFLENDDNEERRVVSTGWLNACMHTCACMCVSVVFYFEVVVTAGWSVRIFGSRGEQGGGKLQATTMHFRCARPQLPVLQRLHRGESAVNLRPEITPPHAMHCSCSP